MFVLSVEIAALYISVIEERRHLKLPDFTLFKNELLPFRQNCVMVLIKTKKTVCLEENTGLADVLDDAGKKKENDNRLTTDLHFDKWCSKISRDN